MGTHGRTQRLTRSPHDTPGLTTTLSPTFIVVRAPGIAAAAKVGVVLEPHQFPEVASNNFIDDAVFAKLEDLAEAALWRGARA